MVSCSWLLTLSLLSSHRCNCTFKFSTSLWLLSLSILTSSILCSSLFLSSSYLALASSSLVLNLLSSSFSWLILALSCSNRPFASLLSLSRASLSFSSSLLASSSLSCKACWSWWAKNYYWKRIMCFYYRMEKESNKNAHRLCNLNLETTHFPNIMMISFI